MAKNAYSSENIKVLKGLEGIRKRYDMYIGSQETGAYHCYKEVIDNGVDEFLNNYATVITVEYYDLDDDNCKIIVTDNGRGMPIGIHPTEKKPTLEVLLTNIHAGGKFDKNSFKVSGGKNGCGIKATNACSSYTKVTTYTSKDFYGDETGTGVLVCSKGEIKEPFKKLTNKKNIHGTVFEFIPDKEIFGQYSKIDPKLIEENLRIRSYANAGLKTVFIYNDDVKEFYYPNGIQDYLEEIVRKPICDPFYYSFEEESPTGVNFYEIAFQYGNTDDDKMISFVNGIQTSAGTHETGFKMALTTAFNNYIKENKMLPKDIKSIDAEDIRKGFYCIINLRHTDPSYKGQTKDELSTPEVRGIMQKQSNININEWMDKNKVKVKEIANRIIRFAKGRKNANDYTQKVINKVDNSINYSKKFIDCNTTDPNKKRVYLCEGDSAGNNLIYCRDPEYMSVFALRGKPLNIYNASPSVILKNAEMNELCLILFGTNDFKKFNIDEIRSKNIIIASDADIDG